MCSLFLTQIEIHLTNQKSNCLLLKIGGFNKKNELELYLEEEIKTFSDDERTEINWHVRLFQLRGSV
jgi:hypothetical protein